MGDGVFRGVRAKCLKESRFSKLGDVWKYRMRVEGVQKRTTELACERRLYECCSYSETVINLLPGYD
jgi:hypothetical protein